MSASTVSGLVHLEHFARTAVLGIRFWDAVRNQSLDGLNVRARAYASARPEVSGVRTPAGYYAFHGLPGLRAVELGESTGPSRLMLIQVSDPLERFLPVCFNLEVPPATGPIYPPTPAADAPPGTPVGFVLFSAPTRGSSPGVAVLRATLVDRTTGAGAAHAVLEARLSDGARWYGLADARGVVALQLPYPAFSVMPAEDENDIPTPFSTQTWPVEIRASYDPSALEFPPGMTLPDLRSIFAQPAATLWNDPADPSGAALLSRTISFGEELLLRTGDLSVLWVDSGTSP